MSIDTTLLSAVQNDLQPKYERKLINLVNDARKYFPDETVEKFRDLGVRVDDITGKPEKPPKVPFWEKDELAFDASTICWIPVRKCRGDGSYNRAEEIHYRNIENNLNYGDSPGFSYSAASVIEVVYLPEEDVFIVVKGQHRVIKAWLSLGDDAFIIANVRVASGNVEEQIKAEAKKHHIDAQKVTRQKAHQSGLSGYVAGDKEEVKYTEWILAHGVGVKGKMHLFPKCKHFTKECDTPWAVRSAIAINEANCSLSLKLLAKFLPQTDTTINGKSIKAVTQYLTLLQEKLEKTALINNIEPTQFIYDVFEYIFIFRRIKTLAWLKGSNALRGENIIIPLARLIRFTNSYCLEKDLRLPDGRKTEDSPWCSVNEIFWVDFLNKTTPKELHGSVNAILTEC